MFARYNNPFNTSNALYPSLSAYSEKSGLELLVAKLSTKLAWNRLADTSSMDSADNLSNVVATNVPRTPCRPWCEV
eukprot:5112726-Amphidinium_carterae.1